MKDKTLNQTMDIFTEIPFPSESDIVYQIGILIEDSFYLFYIGQSSRNIGRLGDYVSAKFSASTDFKVGKAVKYLMDKGYKVVVRYKISNQRLSEEAEHIKNFKKDYQLLNDIRGYDYRTANEEEEKQKILNYVDRFLETVRSKQPNQTKK